MSDSYFMRGTITIRVDRKTPMIGITPCAGFLTPDKPHKAIAFPISSTRSFTAKLFELPDEKQLECSVVKEIERYFPALITVAAQQKTIELRFEFDEEKADTGEKCKITGFIFPAPLDHAHGR